MFCCSKRELLTENTFNCSLLLFIPLLLARTNFPRFCRRVVVVYVVVFSLRNPPPNRLSSRPLNRLKLPKFTNEAHSPPGVDDDFDAIGNTIARRSSLRLLRLKAAARPPGEKKALKLSPPLHVLRDEQKGALIVLLINILFCSVHALFLCCN